MLSERELNQALIARHQLQERFRSIVPKVIEHVAGLRTKYTLDGVPPIRSFAVARFAVRGPSVPAFQSRSAMERHR